MNKSEAFEWAFKQDVVKVSCIKENEEDKYILTVGEFSVSPIVFDTREEADTFLKTTFKLTNLDLSIICALCQRLNKLNKEQF